ncbi:MAG: hypothetical protein ACLQU4_13360 [Limisphaerales bacterium]
MNKKRKSYPNDFSGCLPDEEAKVGGSGQPGQMWTRISGRQGVRPDIARRGKGDAAVAA